MCSLTNLGVIYHMHDVQPIPKLTKGIPTWSVDSHNYYIAFKILEKVLKHVFFQQDSFVYSEKKGSIFMHTRKNKHKIIIHDLDTFKNNK